ncbi:hypothetical protein CHS0354_003433 [Potamilus streckersoni]|uniref:F-box domain-containing protein n=1 Tax=Potamilus streckersoni TaxID=2493646 RepID=A0AAE0VYK6_9BIVA|nr:hypothetical protein CHS0354_003433 [Potamilus streckersoni]
MEASSLSTTDTTRAVNPCKRKRIDLSDDASCSPQSDGACSSRMKVCSTKSASLPSVSKKQSLDKNTIVSSEINFSSGPLETQPLLVREEVNDRHVAQMLHFGDCDIESGEIIQDDEDDTSEPASGRVIDDLGSGVDSRGDSIKTCINAGSNSGTLSSTGQDVSGPCSSTINMHTGRRESHELAVESSVLLLPPNTYLSTWQDDWNQESKSLTQKSFLGMFRKLNETEKSSLHIENSSTDGISASCSWSYVANREDNQTFEQNLYAVSDHLLKEPHINVLPSSLLLHIFSYLSLFDILRKASLVCKYWYNLCRDPSLWRYLNLGYQMKLTDQVLGQLSLFSERVIYVDLTDCRFLTNTGIRALLNRCRYLQTLKLMRCLDITDDAFIGLDIGKASPHIQKLHFEGCSRLTDKTIIQFAKGCPDIQLLHLNHCNRMTDEGIVTLAENCHKLKRLLLDHCQMVTDDSARALAHNCPDLEYLNLMSCGLSDEGVFQLAKLKKLKVLDLSNIAKLTPRSVVKVAQHCTQLECLNISLNHVMDDACMTGIAQFGSNLRRLYCVSCNITDEGLKNLAKYRPNLEALDIAWCRMVTIKGVKALSEACPKLVYLGLIKCDNVQNDAMDELVVQFPHIKYSTFILESRRVIDRARREGFQFISPFIISS